MEKVRQPFEADKAHEGGRAVEPVERLSRYEIDLPFLYRPYLAPPGIGEDGLEEERLEDEDDLRVIEHHLFHGDLLHAVNIF